MSYMQPAINNGDRSVLALVASGCVCSEVVLVRRVSTTVVGCRGEGNQFVCEEVVRLRLSKSEIWR